jgi:hypothetical protein
VLRPAVAAEACRALGIPLSAKRLRSALDVDELMLDWAVASDAGFIVAQGRYAYASPDLAAPPDPGLLLNAWVTAAVTGLGVPDEPCAGCLTVLHELHTNGQPQSIEDLATAVTAVGEFETAQAEPCPDCGGIHNSPDLLGLGGLIDDEDIDGVDGLEHAEGTVVGLAAFGAVATANGSAPDGAAADGPFRLTPLGSMLAAAVFEGSAPAADADAGAVISAISDVPPSVAWTMMRPWLDARSADSAVGELLAFAETASAGQRVAAIALASEVGPKAARTWRQWAKRPGFGAYARQWLADHRKPAAHDPSDEAWLAVDALAIMLDALSDALPPFLLAAAVQQQLGTEATELLPLLRESGHPAADGIMTQLGLQPAPTGRLSLVPSLPDLPGLQDPLSARPGTAAGRRARPKRGQRTAADQRSGTCQIKISLCGVTKPPVWRRVVIPADITLGELHGVIQQAMGWEDGHLHVFSTGGQQYGSPDPELGHADEASVRLLDLLSAPGDKLRYTYDFGDDWEHDIALEDISLDEAAAVSPSCPAGKGACPPEDCGGIWGYAHLQDVLADPRDEDHGDMLDWLGLDSADEFDPRKFSIDEVNTRLAHLTIAR